jgi:hypothetical protein
MNARYPLDPERQLHEIEEQYESYSEMRAEFGSSYVCGGGYAHDVGAAFAQFHPELITAHAEMTRDSEALCDWLFANRLASEPAPASVPDDCPF